MSLEFDSLEIQQVENGFVVTVNTEEGVKEYVFTTARKSIQFIKEYVEAKGLNPANKRLSE